VVSVAVSDNVGVAGVSIKWTGPENGSGSMRLLGGQWRLESPGATLRSGPYDFTVTARDAAGNRSTASARQVPIGCIV
jgi:hypothetical protein